VLSSDDWNPAALDEHLRLISYRYGRGAPLFLVGFVLVLWPTDWLVFRGIPVGLSLAWVRVAIIGISLATYAVFRFTQFGARQPVIVFGGGGSMLLFAVGYALGGLGGADQPWIHLGYPALFFSVLAPMRIRPRAWLVAALLVSLFAGFLLPYPAHRTDPMTLVAISFAVSTGMLVIAVGHLAFRILRQSFYQSLAIERASRDLAELNETLESRVREQTQDLRNLTAHLERAREEERTRISRELHDELGQELTAMNLALTLTQQRYTRDPQCVRSNLTELEALLARTRTTTRNLVADLRPRLLDELGIRAAIEWLIRQTQERSQLTCRLNADKIETLPAEISTVVFRIVQEALTNVTKHAHATLVDIELRVRGEVLSLTVADDGIGISNTAAGATTPKAGFGLLGIRERVKGLSGEIDIHPGLRGGTRIAVKLPLPGKAEPQTEPSEPNGDEKVMARS
jgi:signal transduction histidine kinase